MSTTRRWAGTALVAALLLGGCSSGGSNSGNNASNGGGTGSGAAAPALPDCPVDAFKNASGPTEVLIWFQISGKAADTLKKMVDQYNASQTKVKVRAEIQGASYEELLRKLQQAIAAKALPDIAVLEETTLRFMVDSKTVLPAQSCLNAEKMSKDGFIKAATDHYSIDGVLYPASASLSDLLTYYNKNHFRRAGLDPEKPPATLDEVRQYAQKIKAAGVADKPIVLKMDSWFIETQLTGNRKPLVNNNNGHGSGETTEALFDTDETRKLFSWIKQMIDEGLMDPVPATEGQANHYLAMATQKSSMSIETSVAATTIAAFLAGDQSVVPGGAVPPGAPADLTGLDVGAGPVFGMTGAGKAQIGGNGFFMLKTTPEKQSASWDFMKWWNQKEQQVTWLTEGSYLPFVAATVDEPRVRTFFKDDFAGRMLATAYEELRTGMNADFTGPVIGPFSEVRDLMRGAMDAVAFQKVDPAVAVRDASTKTNAALKTYNDANF